MTKKTYFSYLQLGLVLLLFFVIACKNDKATEISTDQILPVKSIRVGDNTKANGKNFPARTKPKREVSISFRVAGPLTALNVVEGQKVNKGQLIARIDDRDIKIKLESAKADFELARVERERYRRLFEKQSIAENEYDTKVAVFRTKEARYIDAQNALKDATIYAPFTGFVGEVRVENYEEVQAKQTIVTLLDLSDIEIQFLVPESMLFEKDEIAGFEVYFENYPQKKFSASFKEVGKVATAEGFPVTLTLDTKVPPAEDRINIARAAGFTVRVNILYKDYTETNRVIVPSTAVMEPEAEQEAVVWILNKETMTVHKRKVVIKGFGSTSTLELETGLENGEWIVTAGIHRLKEGQKVKDLPEKL